MKLIFASNNDHKLQEVQQIMPAEVQVVSLREVGYLNEIDETGTTLSANSLIKAETIWQWVKQNNIEADGVFADDTGLEIDALNGEPGVYTARWYTMGEDAMPPVEDAQANYAANRAKALRQLAGRTNRAAQFRTVITLIRPSGTIQVEGVVRGIIGTEEHGTGGFGYDPIFIPEGYDRTFSELPAEVKNSISHRARALAELVKAI